MKPVPSEYRHVLSAVAQFAVAAAGGAWAGHASDPGGAGLALGMAGMAMGLALAYAASNLLGLVFAPVVLAHILRTAARAGDPDATPEAPRRDHVGTAMIAVVIALGFASAIVVAFAVWLLAADAALLPTLARFLAVAFGMAMLAPSARRVVV